MGICYAVFTTAVIFGLIGYLCILRKRRKHCTCFQQKTDQSIRSSWRRSVKNAYEIDSLSIRPNSEDSSAFLIIPSPTKVMTEYESITSDKNLCKNNNSFSVFSTPERADVYYEGLMKHEYETIAESVTNTFIEIHKEIKRKQECQEMYKRFESELAKKVKDNNTNLYEALVQQGIINQYEVVNETPSKQMDSDTDDSTYAKFIPMEKVKQMRRLRYYCVSKSGSSLDEQNFKEKRSDRIIDFHTSSCQEKHLVLTTNQVMFYLTVL